MPAHSPQDMEPRMGTRANTLIAIAPQAKADFNAAWIEWQQAKIDHSAAGTLIEFEANFRPLWCRVDNGRSYTEDLKAEIAMCEWLAGIGTEHFRLVRTGEINDRLGDWKAEAFHDHPDFIASERALQAALSPEYSVLPAGADDAQWARSMCERAGIVICQGSALPSDASWIWRIRGVDSDVGFATAADAACSAVVMVFPEDVWAELRSVSPDLPSYREWVEQQAGEFAAEETVAAEAAHGV